MTNTTLLERFRIGDRVQLHPATSAWMMGDRWGEIVGFTAHNLHNTNLRGVKVRLDKSGKTRAFHPDNVL